MTTLTPYGSWTSPVTTDLIVAGTVGLSVPRWYAGVLYCVESRPQEGGRNVIVAWTAEGGKRDILPAPFNARSRVHEYGGDAWLLHGEHAYFVNFQDQQVYRLPLTGSAEPEQLTRLEGCRFANGTVDETRGRLIYVVEDHRADGEAENYIAAVSLSDGAMTPLARGYDFCSSPALNADGTELAWITWDHPNMPWDETMLRAARLDEAGMLQEERLVAGGTRAGKQVSVQQPQFSPNGILHYVSDESGWWNLHAEGRVDSLAPMAAEFGEPPWGFGIRTYVFDDDQTIRAIYLKDNVSHQVLVNRSTLDRREVPVAGTSFAGLSQHEGKQALLVASPTAFPEIILADPQSGDTLVTVQVSTTVDVDPDVYSIPEAIAFPTADGEDAYGFFYPPHNPARSAGTGEKPPLIVMFHGGPTGATSNILSLRTQYWTTRGFAVLDVNYRGSTGYGRDYRDKLLSQWGVADVEDAVAGVNYLVDEGRVDSKRLAIRGGSAGGYTTLAALTFTDAFSAGASYYGISDLAALAADTHKFESRYLDRLVGRWPEDKAIYDARSPIHHTDQLGAACIFLQGLEDKVVPPNQAEMMVDVLKGKGLPVAYVPFEGEQHGFRMAANIKRSLELEYFFYARVFGFETADEIEPIMIDNLP